MANIFFMNLSSKCYVQWSLYSNILPKISCIFSFYIIEFWVLFIYSDLSSLSYMWSTNIFSHYVAGHFILLRMFFKEQSSQFWWNPIYHYFFVILLNYNLFKFKFKLTQVVIGYYTGQQRLRERLKCNIIKDK